MYLFVIVIMLARIIVGYRLPVARFHRMRRVSSSVVKNMDLTSKPTIDLLKDKLCKSLVASFGSEYGNIDPQVFPAGKPEFGDYQCNVALSLTKKLNMKPREISEKIKDGLDISSCPMIVSTNVSGPGFLNIVLSDEYWKGKTLRMLQDRNDRLAVPTVESPLKVVVDYSSPNIAKEMHVGHLRSTIIGDTLSNMFEFLGHKEVLRLNHVGDWGTQFGMLIQYMKQLQQNTTNNNSGNNDIRLENVIISDLASYYKAAKKCFDESEEFQEQSKLLVVKLQAGDPETVAVWQRICELSRVEFQSIYDQLRVNPNLLERGESFYNAALPHIVNALVNCGIAVERDGAKCIVIPEVEGTSKATNKTKSNSTASASSDLQSAASNDTLVKAVPEVNETVVVIQKSDGGYLYSTTDLAAVQHRVLTEQADVLVYVTDAGQTDHFQHIFSTVQRANTLFPNIVWSTSSKDNVVTVPPTKRKVTLTHVPFGVVLGEDGKKLKSRSGDTPLLKELLSDAVIKSAEELRERSKVRQVTLASTEDLAQPLSDSEIEEKSKIIGIAAIKYADLSINRETNYRFNVTKMLSMNGNTAPYMLYSYARIQGIKRKVARQMMNDPLLSKEEADAALTDIFNKMSLNDILINSSPEELRLVKHILQLDDTLYKATHELLPNYICDYMYELSSKFNKFYENCSVMRAETDELQKSRIALCELTACSLRLCLKLLGIQTVESL